MHVPKALMLVQHTRTPIPITSLASYDQMIITTMDEIQRKDYTMEDSDEKHHRLRIHLPKATNQLCWTT